MAKRFTDTEMFTKQFFMELQPEYKLLWIYLFHACNHAGIWECNWRLASFVLGCDIDPAKAMETFGERVREFRKGKWFIPGFIDFQYGALNPSNRAHNSVINILKKENLWNEKQGAYKPLISPLQGAKDKDKEEDTDKDKEKGAEEKEIFEQIISHLNQKAGTNYRPTTKATQQAIRARLSEDFIVADFLTVIDKKTAEWKGTEYEKYLTPETLFRPGNFEKYLNQKIVPKAENHTPQAKLKGMPKYGWDK